MLFDSEMYIGFAGIVLSVDDVNQYWSLVRPVLVDDSYQYWSAVRPVLLASLTSTGCFLPLRWGLLLSVLQGGDFSPRFGHFTRPASFATRSTRIIFHVAVMP